MSNLENTNNKGILNNGNPITRRQFIRNTALISGSAALMSACNTSSWKIGCYTRPWAKHDYRVALDGIAEAGYKYVGLNTHDKGTIIDMNTSPEAVTAISDEIKSRHLEIITLYCGNFDVKNSIAEGIAGLKRMINNSAICNNPNLVLVGIGDPDLVENYYKVVAECCDYALEKGVNLRLKPLGPLNPTGKDCLHFINKVNNKNFKLWYDPGNVYFYSDGKINPVEDVAEVDGAVVGMTIKDFRLPKNVDVTPGTGMVDFPKLMARLRKGGFKKGPLVVECTNSGDIAYITAEARKARQFLEELTR